MTSTAPQATDHHTASAIPSRDGMAAEDARATTLKRERSASIAGRIAGVYRSAPLETRFLWLLLILFAAKGFIFTFVFPPFTGHDEVAHWAYLEVLVEERRVPVVPDPVEFDATYRSNDNPTFDMIPDYFDRYEAYMTRDWYKGPVVYRAVTYLGDYLPAGWIYTANHPPLYYLLMAPVHALTSGASPETQLYALRLAAVPLGMLTVLFAFLTIRRLFPGDRFLAVIVPTLVAFQPQIAYEAAMLNNDILAIATTSACIYLIVVGLQNRFTVGTCAWLGLALGLAILSKQTAAIIMPVIAIAMILRLGWKNVLEWLPKGGLILGITAVLAAPWYLYMLVTYGNFTALDRIQTLQWWNTFSSGVPPTIFDQLYNADFAWDRWKETWGEFGWRLIPLGNTLLQVLFWGFFASVIGLLIWMAVVTLFRNRLRNTSRSGIRALVTNTDPIVSVASWQIIGVAAMILTCVAAYYAILQFGTTFTLTQARYYFPAVNAAAIVVALGIRMLTPMRLQSLVQTTVFVGMFLLNVVILSSYVIPYWNNGLA